MSVFQQISRGLGPFILSMALVTACGAAPDVRPPADPQPSAPHDRVTPSTPADDGARIRTATVMSPMAAAYIANLRDGSHAPASELALSALAHVYGLRIHLFSLAGIANWQVSAQAPRWAIYLLNTGGHWVVATPQGAPYFDAGSTHSCCWALAARAATHIYYPGQGIADTLPQMRQKIADLLSTPAWLPQVEIQALFPGD